MSLANTYRSNVERIGREVEQLEGELARVSQEEARKVDQLGRVQNSVTPRTPQSVRSQKTREAGRLQSDLTKLVARRADLTKKIADKRSKLRQEEQKLRKEEQRDRDRDQRARKKLDDELQTTLLAQRRRIEELTKARASPVMPPEEAEFDLFISHASEDKEKLVRPLAEALSNLGLRVWYDDFVLTVGDSLRRRIDQGLARSRYGVVVLSEAFFSKEWPQYELDGLVAKEISRRSKAILPIWHKVSKNDVLSYSPTLADKVALSSTLYTVEELASKLAEVVDPVRPTTDG